MADNKTNPFWEDPRFAGIEPFAKKVWLASPTMHGDEKKWVDDAIETNWVSTVGANINEVERLVSEKLGGRHAVGLATGTAALHLAVKLAGEKLYGMPRVAYECGAVAHQLPLPHIAPAILKVVGR